MLSLLINSTELFSPSLFGRSQASIAQRRRQQSKTKPQKKQQVNPSISLTELQRIQQSSFAHQPQHFGNDENDSSSHFNRSSTSPNTKPQVRQCQSEVAKKRKEYMKQLELKELEEQKKSSQFDTAKLDRIRKQAQEKLDEEQDIVKLLKTCSERATTFAIRDQQLKDKAERDKKEQDYEQRMIIAMEIDRLREIEAREAEEKQKLQKMVNDRKIIENQIEERHQARLLLEEARDQENREMLERIQLYQQQDEEKAKERREQAAKAREEIIRANEQDIASKKERRMLEKREDEMMVAYQMEQDEKMRQREAEEAAADLKKRAIQKKLLDEQERTMDRRGELDELRARRAMEDAERKYRQKQLMDAQKKKRDMEILDMAQKQQQREKQQRQEWEKQEQKEEYEAAIRHSHAMAERERKEAERQRQKNEELIANLQTQIDANTKARVEARKNKFKEGAEIRQALAEERVKLEAARDKMIADLKAKGIPESYFSELTTIDIDKFLI